MRSPRAQRGFTLLELTLALSVTALLALTLYTSMSVCIRARRTATTAVQPVRTAGIAMELMSRDLESVVPPTGVLAGPFVGVRQLIGNGAADSVEFCTLGDDGDGSLFGEGVRYVELGLRTDVAPPALVRRVTRNLLAQTQTDSEEEILCRNVSSLALRYFDGSTWLDEWDSTVMGDVLPFAVEIDLIMGDSPARAPDQLPDRIIRVVPLACAKLPGTDTTSDTESTGTGTGTGSGTGSGTGGQSPPGSGGSSSGGGQSGGRR